MFNVKDFNPSEVYGEIGALRHFLHTDVYNDETNIHNLIGLIEGTELFSVNSFDPTTKIITLRVKKTQIKKKTTYCHDSRFYLNTLSVVFVTFLNNFIPSPGLYWNHLINIIALDDTCIQVRL